jgi:hypothetical protein
VFIKDKIHLKKVILDGSCLYKIQDSSKYFDSCAVTGCEQSYLNLNETCVFKRQYSFESYLYKTQISFKISVQPPRVRLRNFKFCSILSFQKTRLMANLVTLQLEK